MYGNSMSSTVHHIFENFENYLSYILKNNLYPNVCDPPGENQPRNTILKYSGTKIQPQLGIVLVC